MKLRVLFFSILRDITAAGEVEIYIACPEPKVSDLLDTLYERWPRLREWNPSLLIAVDHVFCHTELPLHADAEVAIMPPVQGG